MPRVSVIIPAFNAEQHIAEALSSVSAQTYDDWEVIVADDRSTDATPEIAAGFAHVKVVRTPARTGPSSARNVGVAAADGELLAFLDADDYWLPECLASQVALFDRSGGPRAGIGIVATNARILGPDGRLLPDTYADYMRVPHVIDLTALLRWNAIFVSALTPRHVFDEVGGFAPEILGTGDHDLWIRILERGYKVASNPEPLAVYRVTPGSLSQDKASMARAAQTVYNRALERGNLTPTQRQIARRALRQQRVVERVLSRHRSLPELVATLLLAVLVVAENPRWVWSVGTRLARRKPLLSSFSI